MFPRKPRASTELLSFPHAGGDVSAAGATQTANAKFSPRRWGCFSARVCGRHRAEVFPTQVGMFLRQSLFCRSHPRFPHAGGDVSLATEVGCLKARFSPRRWGCLQWVRPLLRRSAVFPTQVGMFPESAGAREYRRGFPHAGGDVSVGQRFDLPVPGFPHAGGDVSESERRDCC